MLANKLLAASGGVDTLFVDDVFSAFTYTGTGVARSIVNGIDLAGKGGLVWSKDRSTAEFHNLADTARGATNTIYSNDSRASFVSVNGLTAFNANGYAVGTEGEVNRVNDQLVSWTFRRAPKFFDIVTYTGNGTSNRAISHALGIAPGMLWSKSTSTTGNWNVFHRSATGDLVLNTTAAQTGSRAIMVAASDTTFTVSGVANTNGVTYVAHLYAHDPSAEGIIQCGSAVSTGAGFNVNLGWEPQLVLQKRIDFAGGWQIADTARSMGVSSGGLLQPQSSASEISSASNTINANGFYSGSDGTNIYLAIRRPNKPPTLGTQVYNAIARSGNSTITNITGVGFAPDMAIVTPRSSVPSMQGFTIDRLRGVDRVLYTSGINGEVAGAGFFPAPFMGMNGITIGSDGGGNGINTSGITVLNSFFKRAPGVFDVVAYSGTGANSTQAHNLQIAPELWIIKKRNEALAWVVGSTGILATRFLTLNESDGVSTNATMWNSTFPSSTVFSLGTNVRVNEGAGYNYVAYLFATKAGISKVGSYTGNGSSQTINAGFTTGARFILIKRTESTGDWYVWDTVRGIVAGNDPHLSLNTTAAEVTTDDSIDPHTSGFIVNQLAATNINVSAGTYIYLSFA